MLPSRENAPQIRIITGVLAFAVILVALLMFLNANMERITEQNESYLQTSTDASARRINDLLGRSLDIVETASAVYERNVSPDNMANPENIAPELAITSFDYTLFVTPDGIGYRDYDGEKADVSDKEYYIEGMKGESGISAISQTAFSDRNALVFYSPIIYDGTVRGVLCGAYRENTISERYMDSSYFGVATPTYMIAPNGLILARSESCNGEPDTVQELLEGYDTSVPEEEILANLQQGTPIAFTYRSDEHEGIAYMTKLGDYDWLLLRSFPEAITRSMVKSSYLAGMLLVAGVSIAACIIIMSLVFQSLRKQKTLLFERQHVERIVDTSTMLFNSMLDVDVEKGAYVFLKTDRAFEIPSEGRYDDLIELLSKHEFPNETPTNVSDELSLDGLIDKMKGNNVYYQFEYCMDSDGRRRWIQISVLKMSEGENGKVSRVLIVTQDTSNIKENEARQRHAIEEAHRAAEYASQAKSDFLNNMSHDIRTPMNSIMGMTSIAAMHLDDTERVRRCLENISSASRHLLGLINEVLDMSKIESGNITLAEDEFELSELIENVMTIIYPQAERNGQHLSVELSHIEHENVTGDLTRLQQIFINILSNAIKFTETGGEIGLKITELPSNIAGNAKYEFVFADTGCGMTPEFTSTVFDPFTRANDTRTTNEEGTGLGMSIAKRIVELMNGDIGVESEVGVGTRFTVTVSLKFRDERVFETEDFDGSILVVDEEIDSCRSTCAMLNELGVTADYANSGKDALAMISAPASKGNSPYAAVIMDWRMSGKGSIEIARAIRSQTGDGIPIIALFGYDWSSSEEEAAKAIGIDAFLMKPLFKSQWYRFLNEHILMKDESSLDQSAALEALAFAGKRILIAEDNPMAAEVACDIIGMTGAEIVHAENGKIAYEILTDNTPGYCDLVFMDIQMPVMNGYEATKLIRQAGTDGRADLAKLPIIALSADAFADDVRKSREAGMNEHLSKPLELDSLIRMLAKWLGSNVS